MNKDRETNKSVEMIREEAESLVSDLSGEEFIRLQREIQYALVHHRDGARRVKTVFIGGDVPSTEFDRLFDLQKHHGESIDKITNGPIYNMVRNGMHEREMGEVPDNWTGWILESREQVEEAEKASRTIVANTKGYGIFGLIGPAKEEQKKEAKEKLREFGITGIFVESENKQLETLMQEWGKQEESNTTNSTQL